MNKLRIAGLMVWLFAGTTVLAQNAVIDQVKETIKAGSAKELAKYLSASVDITFDGKPNHYSKAQAEFVLRDFFRAHPPNEFTVLHQGSSKGGQPFAIGNYKSGNDTYRIWIKFKTTGNQTLVQEISFSLVKE